MINIIKILTYKKSNYSARKISNFNDYLKKFFSILLTKFKQKTSKRPKNFRCDGGKPWEKTSIVEKIFITTLELIN